MFGAIHATDKQYDNLLHEIRTFYDSEIIKGQYVEMRIKARDGKVIGYEYVKNKPA